MNNNYKRIAVAIFAFIFGLGLIGSTLFDQCKSLSNQDCNSLWFLFIVATIGGVLITETLSNQHAQKDVHASSSSDKDAKISGSQIWASSIFRIILSTIMLSLPIIYQGAFVASFGGLVFGYAINGLWKAITNQPPPFA